MDQFSPKMTACNRVTLPGRHLIFITMAILYRAILLLCTIMISAVVATNYSSSTCTLGSVVASPGNCNTDILSGITTQIFKQMVQEGDGFAVITGSDIKRNSGCTPYLQLAALNALHRATAQKGASIVLNSAYRSAAEQYVLYEWYLHHKCDIPLAAKPGTSNHEGGAAIDVSAYQSWKPALSANGWKWFGNSDRVHFSYVGAGTKDLRRANLKAFQTLWNAHNPHEKLVADGLYGPATAAAMSKTPCGGF